jgi:hypothetical protein
MRHFTTTFNSILLLAVIVLLVAGCGGGGSSSNGPGNNTGTSFLTMPETMFMILDSQEKPLEYALVGGEVSDSTGVASGTVQKTASGWVVVSAPGYADGYTRPAFLPSLIQSDLYIALLTSFQDMARINSAQQITLNAQNNILLTLDSSLLSTLPALVGVSEINPNTIGPLFENLNPLQALNLQAAFAIQAFDLSFNRVNMTAGQTLTVTLIDGLGQTLPPVLAYFDADSGLWQVIENACIRIRDNTLSCTVNRFSPLFGLFTAEPVNYLTLSTPVSGRSDSRAASRLAENSYSSDSIIAYNRVRSRLKQMENEGNFDLNDPALNQALSDLAKAATDYANSNRNEQGKSALMAVAEAAMLQGNDAVANDAINKAKNIANEMGQNLLNEDCSRYREILHVAEQNLLLGNDSMAAQLETKLANELSSCDVWSGKITYWMRVADPHPALNAMSMVSGGGLWTEQHAVRITTDPRTFESHGEDTLQISFSSVKYENNNLDCEQSFNYDASGQVILEFDGSYDGHAFSMGDVALAGGSSAVSINQRQVMEGEDSDGNCQIAQPFPLSLNYPHFSFLAHGASSPSPPLTIQEILDSAAGQTERFGGDESFTNDQVNLGTYPFISGNIMWYFYHVQKVLPVAD